MADETPATLGSLLRQLRGDRPIDWVADQIGVVKSAVYLWESSGVNRLPSPHRLHRMLELYGATEAQRLLAWELRSHPPAAGVA